MAKYQQQRAEADAKPSGQRVRERASAQRAYRVGAQERKRKIQEAMRNPGAAVGWFQEECNTWTRTVKGLLAIVDAYPDVETMRDLAASQDPLVYRAIAEQFPNGLEMRTLAYHLADCYAQLVFHLRPALHLYPEDATAADAETAVTTYFRAIEEFPLHMHKRITNPLFPGQSESMTYNLAGLMLNKIGTTPPVKKVREDQGGWLKDLAPMTAADKEDQNKNKKIINVLKEDREEGKTLRETLAAQLAGAVFEVAHNPEKTGDLSKFRGAVTRLIERGEPDAGRKTSLDELFARRGGEGNWHPRLDGDELAVKPGAVPDKDTDARTSNDQAKLDAAEIEEFGARDEARRAAEQAKAAANFEELHAAVKLSALQDRVLVMWLAGATEAETARELGPTASVGQVKAHRQEIKKKYLAATGNAA